MCSSLHSVPTALVRTQAAWRTETVLMFARLLLRAKNLANPTCGYKPVRCYRCKGIHGYTPKRSVPPLFHLHSVLSQDLQDFMSLRLTVYRASSCFFRSVKQRTTDSKVSQTAIKNFNILFASCSLPCIFFRLNHNVNFSFILVALFMNHVKSQRAGISPNLEKRAKFNYCVLGSIKNKLCYFLSYIWIIFYGLLFSEYTFYR